MIITKSVFKREDGKRPRSEFSDETLLFLCYNIENT